MTEAQRKVLAKLHLVVHVATDMTISIIQADIIENETIDIGILIPDITNTETAHTESEEIHHMTEIENMQIENETINMSTKGKD